MSITSAPSTVGEAIIAVVRTVVPTIVGYLLALFVLAGVDAPESLEVILDLLVTAVLTALYYVLIRWLQSRWEWVGWLLGYPLTPSYAAAGIPDGYETDFKAESDGTDPDSE